MKTRRGYEERMLLGLSSDESNRSERKILMMSREREREKLLAWVNDLLVMAFLLNFHLHASDQYKLFRQQKCLTPSFISLRLRPFRLFPYLPLQKNK